MSQVCQQDCVQGAYKDPASCHGGMCTWVLTAADMDLRSTASMHLNTPNHEQLYNTVFNKCTKTVMPLNSTTGMTVPS